MAGLLITTRRTLRRRAGFDARSYIHRPARATILAMAIEWRYYGFKIDA
jgi:hypothetical protein